MKVNWMLPQFVLNFATTPTITPDSGGSDAGSGGGAGAGAGSSPSGGGGGGGTPQTPSTPATINWESAPQHFRDGYNKLKSDFEKLQNDYKPWQGLKDVRPDQVPQ